MIIRGFQQVIALSCLALFLANCGGGPKGVEDDIPDVDPMTNLGIGPVKSMELSELDQAMADEGKKIYDAKCTACHNIKTKMIGPPQAGVLDRRTPEWVMNMIVNPSEMIKKDPTARRLLKEYNNVPMTEQGVTEEEARKILEYFRTM